MTPETTRALCAITERFYRTRADAFAAKRERPWPGMVRVLDELPAPPGCVLDVGCGHGRFAALIAERLPGAGYTGVDASEALLGIARRRSDVPPDARWQRGDVVFEPGDVPPGPFDLIAMFAVIHHVPGEARRAELIRELAGRLAPGGTLAIGFWRTLGDDARRHVDWDAVGIDPNELEEGDRLQSFDADDEVPRYAHFASEDEIERIAATTDLPLARRFDSDGSERVSNAYLLWRRPAG